MGNPGDRGGPPVLLFDGKCNLCNAWVRFVLPRDPSGRLKLAALQSATARALLNRHGLEPHQIDSLAHEDAGTLAFLDQGKIHFRSSAVLRLCRYLCRGWPALSIFLLLPRPLRDGAYRFIACRRYRWFGRAERCLLPEPGTQNRFLS